MADRLPPIEPTGPQFVGPSGNINQTKVTKCADRLYATNESPELLAKAVRALGWPAGSFGLMEYLENTLAELGRLRGVFF
jgi:hypothetical protein